MAAFALVTSSAAACNNNNDKDKRRRVARALRLSRARGVPIQDLARNVQLTDAAMRAALATAADLRDVADIARCLGTVRYRDCDVSDDDDGGYVSDGDDGYVSDSAGL